MVRREERLNMIFEINNKKVGLIRSPFFLMTDAFQLTRLHKIEKYSSIQRTNNETTIKSLFAFVLFFQTPNRFYCFFALFLSASLSMLLSHAPLFHSKFKANNGRVRCIHLNRAVNVIGKKRQTNQNELCLI